MSSGDPAVLRADIFGAVAVLHVEDGAAVAPDDKIMDIEAMKVFYPVVAPVAGIVRLSVALGQVVDEGDVVGTIEPTPT